MSHCLTGWRASEDKTKCLANKCSCPNGIAATGAKCVSDEAKICERCNAGFKLDVDKIACAGTVLLSRHDNELGVVR